MKVRFLLLFLLLPILGLAQTYTYSTFARLPANSKNKKINSSTGFLTPDGAGNLYGYCEWGLYGCIFKVTSNAVLSTVFDFGSRSTFDCFPEGALILDSAGNFYGELDTASLIDGEFFKVTPSGQETTEWISPQSNLPFHPYLFLDSAGNLFGYDTEGSSPNGISNALFQISSSGTHTLLYTFCQQTNCTDGEFPAGGPIVNGADGNIYGVAALGGQFGQGVVFRVTPDGQYTVLYNFTGGSDGGEPEDRLTPDRAGNMYGTAFSGGANGGGGVVFKITTAGVFTVLHSFCTTGCPYDPAGPVVLDGSGNLYGTTSGGGSRNGGVVYKITSAGIFETIFNAASNQIGKNIVFDKSGNLYGVTVGAGRVNAAVFKLTKH